MAVRALFGRTGAAAGAAAIGASPSTADCRAATAPASGAKPTNKGTDGIRLATKLDDDALDASEGWLAASVLDSGELTLEEVSTALGALGALGSNTDGMREVLDIAEGRGEPDVGEVQPARVMSIGCSDSTASTGTCDDSSSVESYGVDADAAIESPWLSPHSTTATPQLSAAVHELLSNREVQLAVSRALDSSPAFNDFLMTTDPELFERVQQQQPLLLAGSAGAAPHTPPKESNRNALEKGLSAALDGLAALGESLVGVGEGFASFLASLAGNIRSALEGGKKKKASSESQAAQGGIFKRYSLLRGAVFSLAVAVFALIVLRRVRVPARFA